MKIATYNVNGITARLPVYFDGWRNQHRYCMPAGIKSTTGKVSTGSDKRCWLPSQIWHGQKSWNGVAILVT